MAGSERRRGYGRGERFASRGEHPGALSERLEDGFLPSPTRTSHFPSRGTTRTTVGGNVAQDGERGKNPPYVKPARLAGSLGEVSLPR